MIKLKINKITEVKIKEAFLYSCIDKFNNTCQVVVMIINLDTEENGQLIEGSCFNLVKTYPYEITWDDEEIIEFATQMVDKRYE